MPHKPKSVHFHPARVALYFTAISGLAAAVAVPLANLDVSSTAGVISGLVAILGAYNTWAKGERAYEERNETPSLGFPELEVPGVDLTPKVPAQVYDQEKPVV